MSGNTHTVINKINVLLVTTIVALAIITVYSAYLNRQHTASISQLEKKLNNQHIENSKLQLEEGTHVDHGQIVDKVRKELGLRTPLLGQQVRVTP